MKLLLDACVPRKLKHLFNRPQLPHGFASRLRWKQNGELLALAERAGFEVLLTRDRGIMKQ
jgi:hypothetical protein